MTRFHIRFSILSTFIALCCAVPLRAQLPTGGSIASGAATIQQNGSAMTIQQSSQKLGLNWQSFNVGAGNSVNFLQPNASSIALNRVLGNDASSIFGSLQANGSVFLINPNGVLFAPGAQVNVGGLVASTLGLSDADFAAGNYLFTNNGKAGSVINQGHIQAGNVALLGPQIVNSGIIDASGSVALAAGDAITVKLLESGLLTAHVDKAALRASIQNHGQIVANGGQVQLLADAIQDSLLNTDGLIQAKSLVNKDGHIYLSGGSNGTVTVSGALDVSGVHGGDISVLGKQVGLMGGAKLDASGNAGGGTVLAGGNWHGEGPEQNASATYMDANASIQANGPGGQVVLWSNDYTGFYGNISAQGGSVETSSHNNLQAFGQVNAGTWLLDPTDVTIVSGSTDTNDTDAGGIWTPTTNTAQIGVTNINNDLNAGTSVTINTASAGTATGDITQNSGATISKTAGSNASLTMNAAGSITLGDSIASSAGQLAVTLNANGGAVSGSGASINTNGGLLTVNSASGAGAISNAISGTGALTKTGAGTTILTANNTYTGATTVDAGTLSIGNGGTAGAISASSAVSIAGGATMEWNDANFVGTRTIANNISGAGTLVLQGQNASNALQTSLYDLTGNNSGLTGTLRLDRSIVWNTFQQSEVGSATIEVGQNATMGFNGGTFANDIVVQNGAGWYHSVAGGAVIGAIRLEGNNTLSGNIQLNNTNSIVLGDNTGANSTIGSYGGGTQTLTGVISGLGDFSMSRFNGWNGGSGATVNIILAGSQSNTYTGNTVIDGQGALATLTLAKTGGAVAIPGNSTVQMGSQTAGQANLRMGGNDQFGAGVVMNTVNTAGNWMRFDLMGTNQTLAGVNSGTTSTTGGGVIQDGGINAPTSTNGTLTLNGTGSYVFNGVMRNIDGGGGTGLLNLIKNGNGTQTLAGSGTAYTGTTTVNDGTLVLRDATGFNSATTVNSGATLELAGTGNANQLAGFSITLNDGSTLNKTNTNWTAFNSSDVTINGTVALNVANNGVNNQLFIGGASTGLQGSGTINLTNTGSATTGLSLRTGPGNFSGTINTNGGALNIGGGASLALQNVNLNLTNGARLNLAGSFAANASPVSVKALNGDSSATATLGGQTLTVGTNNGSGDFAGVISGTGALIKTGTGTQTLSGNNTYSGTTTIGSGVLQIGNGSTSGTLGTGAVTDNASLVFDRTNTYIVSNVIGGTGAVEQTGTGTTIFTGNNTYSSTTTVSAGTLQVGNNGTTGTLGTGPVTDNANLVFNRSNTLNLSTLASNAAGITGQGNVSALIGGGFNVDCPIALSGANSNILLEAGKNQLAGDTSGGEVTLSSAISTSATGTVTVFSGNANTAALDAQVSGATLATRYKAYNASASDTTGAVAGTRNYYYRQNPGALTVSGLTATKTYDGLLDASAGLNTSAATVAGGIDGDTPSYSILTLISASFDSAHAGSRNLSAIFGANSFSYTSGPTTWSVSGYSGTSTASGTGTITPKPLTTSINAVGKTYDGLTTTGSTLSAPSGFIGNDSATGVSGLLLAFDDANAGSRNVTASGTGNLIGFSGTARGNGSGIGAGNEVAGLASDYSVPTPAPASAIIGQAPLTVTANNDAKIVTQSDTSGYNSASISGFVHGETEANLGGSLSITRSNAGTEAAGNYPGVLVPSGYSSSNYTINYANGDYKILPAQRLLVKLQNVTNAYGISPAYAVNSVQYLDASGTAIHSLTETARTGNTYTYTDDSGGSVTFTVTPQGAVISNAGYLAVGNYALSGSDASITGTNFVGLSYVGNQSVRQIGLTPSGDGVSKVYDGTTGMTGLTLGLTGKLNGDLVLTSGDGTYQSKNAGSNLGYDVDNITINGADAGNYYLATGGGFSGTDGIITPRAITASVTANDKVYDGATAATLTTAGLNGILAGDTVALDATGYSALFNDRNAGLNKAVTVSGLGLSGADAGNYTLTQPSGLTADITPRPLVLIPNAATLPYTSIPLDTAIYSRLLSNYTITGLVDSDALSSRGVSLTGSMSFDGNTGRLLIPGTYLLGPGTLLPSLTDSNYTIAFGNPLGNALTILTGFDSNLTTAATFASSDISTIRLQTNAVQQQLGTEPSEPQCLLSVEGGSMKLPAGLSDDSGEQLSRACRSRR